MGVHLLVYTGNPATNRFVAGVAICSLLCHYVRLSGCQAVRLPLDHFLLLCLAFCFRC